MISSVLVQGLKGRNVTARGNAPGNRANQSQVLKGRNKMFSVRAIEKFRCVGVALTGLDLVWDVKPGALPRAVALRPCRAGRGLVNA